MLTLVAGEWPQRTGISTLSVHAPRQEQQFRIESKSLDGLLARK